MRLALNIMWLVFGGWAAAASWLVAGAVMAITVVGMPYAYAAWRTASYMALPFGRQLVRAEFSLRPRAAATAVANALWVLLGGWWLAAEHLLWGVGLCLTVIGIPFGVQHLKFIRVSLAPLGRRVVNRDLLTFSPVHERRHMAA